MSDWRIQSLRYLVSGALANLALYAAYVAITALGAPPKPAMSALFALGILLSFVLNKNWAFAYSGPSRRALPRFALAYGAAYFLNLGMLELFADRLGWPHQLVQAAALGINAGLLFLAQRYWIFRVSAPAQ